MVINETISFSTRGSTDIIDITGKVKAVLDKHGVKNGAVTVFIPGSTGAITTIEYERGVISDLRQLINELIPPDREYLHNQAWGDGNAHSHLGSALLGPSLSVPVVDGSLTLGTWQQIVFIDFDNRPRKREIILQLIGE